MSSVRTSQSHPLLIAELTIGNRDAQPGVLGLTFCPGKTGGSVFGAPWDRDLDTDLDVIRRWGAVAVITLMEQHELDDLQVSSLGASVHARGMKW